MDACGEFLLLMRYPSRGHVQWLTSIHPWWTGCTQLRQWRCYRPSGVGQAGNAYRIPFAPRRLL